MARLVKICQPTPFEGEVDIGARLSVALGSRSEQNYGFDLWELPYRLDQAVDVVL